MGLVPTSDPHYLKEHVGLMLQKWTDHGDWTVREFLRYLRSSYRLLSLARLNQLVLDLGLSELLSTRLSRLSGGERRRVDVAAAMIGDPDVLILDEPTGGFDVSMRRKFHDTLGAITGKKLLSGPLMTWSKLRVSVIELFF